MNMTPLSGSNKIVVVGGGAAGMMAAGMAAQAGAQVTLLEQNGRLGKKLLITGKGRCNVTNDCPWQDVLQSVPTNPRFLYSALAGFSPAAAKKFFEDYGCALKTERGNRVFPESDRASDIVDALFLSLTGRSPFWMRSNGSCVHTMCVSCRAKRRRSPFPMAA